MTKYVVKLDDFYSDEEIAAMAKRLLAEHVGQELPTDENLIRPLKKDVNIIMRIVRDTVDDKVVDGDFVGKNLERRHVKGLTISLLGQKVRDDREILLNLPEEHFTEAIKKRISLCGFVYNSYCAASIIADKLQTRIIEPYINEPELSEEEAIKKLKALELWIKNDVLYHCNAQGGKNFVALLDSKIETWIESWKDKEELPKVCIARVAAGQSVKLLDKINKDRGNAQAIIEQSVESIDAKIAPTKADESIEIKKGILGMTTSGIETAILMLLYPLCRDLDIMQNQVTKWYKVTSKSNASVTLEIKANEFLKYCRLSPTQRNRNNVEESLLNLSNTLFRINTKKRRCGGSFIFFDAGTKNTGTSDKKWTVTLNNTLYQIIFDRANIKKHGFAQIAPELFLYIIEMSKSVKTINSATNIIYNCAFRLANGQEFVKLPLEQIGYAKERDRSGRLLEIIENSLRKGEANAKVSINRTNMTIDAVYPIAHAQFLEWQQKRKELSAKN